MEALLLAPARGAGAALHLHTVGAGGGPKDQPWHEVPLKGPRILTQHKGGHTQPVESRAHPALTNAQAIADARTHGHNVLQLQTRVQAVELVEHQAEGQGRCMVARSSTECTQCKCLAGDACRNTPMFLSHTGPILCSTPPPCTASQRSNAPFRTSPRQAHPPAG